jgi:DnaJ-class molecular chaperone
MLSAFFCRYGRRSGGDRHYCLQEDFLDAVNGASWRVTLPDGASLDVAISPGTYDGQTLRLAGKDDVGPEDGEGEALIEIAVRPHPFFERDSSDIRLDLPILLTEAVLGGKVTVPTPAGPVTATIPKGSTTGTILRLRGKGVPDRDGSRGDEYLALQVMLPDPLDAELEAFVSRWPAGRARNPQRKMWN